MQLLVSLLVPLAVWRIIVSRKQFGDEPSGARIAGGFAAWALVGVGLMASAFTALGPLVFLPLTALLVLIAAAACPDPRGIVGVGAGIGAGLVYIAVVLSTDSGWSVSTGTAQAIGVVGGLLMLESVVVSLVIGTMIRRRGARAGSR